MAGRNIVVIGGSSGALEPLRTVVATLPPAFSAAVFVVIHTAAESARTLDRVLTRAGPLPVSYARHEQHIDVGHIYIAPPDHHLLIDKDVMRVTRGPRENRVRPAVDPLFRTAAAAHGSSVVGIILSGGQNDGALGLEAIKRAGGVTIVQDPDDAQAPGMPQAAIAHVDVDHVLRATDIASVLSGLVWQRAPGVPQAPRGVALNTPDVAETGAHDIHHASTLGPGSPFTCPDCGGVLWMNHEGDLLQFRCHLGHRYTDQSLEAAQVDRLDHALWAALRALEENAELRHRMAVHAHRHGMSEIASGYEERARESEQRAASVRRVLMPDVEQPVPGTGVEATARKPEKGAMREDETE